ncbi:MAG TPA: hypothetical protein VEZ89_18545, partial [Rubrivivax sp.]|nr:hypothetical protein [Rubrivivax sp.]
MRAVASVTLSFGLVAIPVKLYAATDASSAIRFKLMSGAGARVRQQYVAEAPPEQTADDAIEAADPAPPPVSRSSALRREASAPAPQLALLPPSCPPPPVTMRSLGPVTPIKDPEPPTDDEDDQEEAPTELGSHLERHEMVRGYQFEKGRFVL